MADDRDELFGDAFGEGESREPDHGPTNEEGPQGELGSQPQGKSKTVKILLIVLAVLAFGAVLCCGGGILVSWYFKPIQTTQVAEEVVAKTNAIADIDLPDGFVPAIAIDMNVLVVQMQMVFYEAPGRGVFMMGQAQGQGANQAQLEQQLRESMQQQEVGEKLTVQSKETRTVSVDGQDVDFQFSTATNNKDGSAWKQVTGAFPGKNGTVFLMIQQPETSFDEDEVTGILESIHTQ